MAWHSLFSLDRKGHFVKTGLILLVVSGTILYGELNKWWNIDDGKILVIVGIVFIIGWLIFIKGFKMGPRMWVIPIEEVVNAPSRRRGRLREESNAGPDKEG